MSQSQQNPLVPHLVDAQAAAVSAQQKVIGYHENQIKQLNELATNLRAEKEASQKEAASLRSELLRLKNTIAQQKVEQKDNVPEDTSPVEVVE